MPFSIAPGRMSAEQPKTSPTSAEQSAKARAIARLTGDAGNSQGSPVQNANNISVEEMGAVKTQTKAKKSLAEAVKTQQGTDETQEEEIVSETESLDSSSESTEVVEDGQTDKVESAESTEETKTETKTDPLSSQYANLARKEKNLRAKVQAQDAAIKVREDALKAREEALAAKDIQYKQGYISKDEFSKNPWKHLAEAGISYDQLTEMALNQKQMDPMVLSEIQSLKADLAAEREARKKYEEKSTQDAQESQTKAYQQAIVQLKADAKSLVEGNREAFEAINEVGALDDVVELIEQTWKEDGELLSVEDAAKQIEEYLEGEALRLAKLKKIQNKLQPAAAKTEDGKVEVKFSAKQPQTKTITNAMGTNRPLSAKERAILAFKGEKKQ